MEARHGARGISLWLWRGFPGRKNWGEIFAALWMTAKASQ